MLSTHQYTSVNHDHNPPSNADLIEQHIPKGDRYISKAILSQYLRSRWPLEAITFKLTSGAWTLHVPELIPKEDIIKLQSDSNPVSEEDSSPPPEGSG
ncbi:hypothetical protein BDD12DRAFT_890093 [Trichophaea hybrida]|nr:hypothetical protein BDD12DRAFT_890093 [Trichophaea hybrida]